MNPVNSLGSNSLFYGGPWLCTVGWPQSCRRNDREKGDADTGHKWKGCCLPSS